MIFKIKITLLTIALGLAFIVVGCDDQPKVKKNKVSSNVVSGKIIQPAVTPKDKKTGAINSKSKAKPKEIEKVQVPEQKANILVVEEYNFQGKINPFKSLIQEKQEDRPVLDNTPKRILTPLEKIELSQIRLVAVIIMKNKQVAMVEEASGKGYEVRVGTYIGKNQGRVSEIKSSSIVIKEVVRDYKGRLKENLQEIKLHKLDSEG